MILKIHFKFIVIKKESNDKKINLNKESNKVELRVLIALISYF